ncbi:hypothetical protein UFOVP36_66 [uncultured Caudovirales phage]|uniref:Putative DnaT-like domain-containing protein n=1 Tax=uncultured Caudovirales phage TaxID=2100421 RepID=A0A6J5KMZ0_9CAUD|nr:hypothetical protein UFOVP36_66 [uncultured Caudovirales phage]
MALTVENGNGLEAADAYVSLTEFKEFCSKRGYRWEDYEDFDIEASIRLATGWIDTYNRYKGGRLTYAQALEFPRTGLVDWSSFAVVGVPQRVKHACSELAYKGLSDSLYQDQDRGGKTVSESVGPISVTYAADAPTGKVWQFASNLLRPYIRDPDQILGPLSVDPLLAPSFSLGMHDTNGDVSLD